MKRFIGWRGLVSAALLVFCGLAFGESNPPVPSASHGQGETNRHYEQEEQKEQNDEKATASNPIFVKLLPGELSEIETKKAQYEGEEKPTLDRRLTDATLATAVISALMAGISALMAYFTWHLWRDSKRNFDETIDQMRSSTHSQLRAYVGPESASYSVKENDKGELVGQILIRLKNFGSTPAVNVSGETWRLVKNRKEVDIEKWFEQSKHCNGHGFGMIEPNLILPMPIDIDKALPLSETSVFARASIKYSDVFGKTYRRSFTFYMPRSSVKDGCNSADLHIKPQENNEEQVNA